MIQTSTKSSPLKGVDFVKEESKNSYIYRVIRGIKKCLHALVIL